MNRFRFSMIAGLLVCLAPLVAAMISGAVAGHFGCRLHEGYANPCLIGGVDRGGLLYGLFVSGWLMLITLPAGVVLLAIWAIVEVVRFSRRAGRG